MDSINLITEVKLEEVKKVLTFDVTSKEENGFLVELLKDNDKTVAYLTATKPGAFKGYHEHTIRASRYLCLKGTMRIILYVGGANGVNGKRQEYVLSADKPQRLTIPPHTPTGLENIGSEESWLVNFPIPYYDPNLKDEQIDYTREEIEQKG